MDKSEAIAILKEVAKHYCDDVDACEWCDKTICSVKVNEAIKVIESE